jgi:general L-amino acid transport system permease protein
VTPGDALPRRVIDAANWMRSNLFSSPLNTALTAACVLLLFLAVPPALDWLIIDANFAGDGRASCTGGGACWVFVKARLGQFLYGFYPEGERWRVILAFALLLIGTAPLVRLRFPRKALIAALLLCAYLAIAVLLFHGGAGLSTVETAKWGGLFLTLVVAGVGITASFPIGIALALGRRSRMPVIRALCIAFIELVRGVPLITVLFMASVMLPLFLPEGVTFDKLLRALIGIALFYAAYMAEVVRGGLQAIPRAQYEAAESLGYDYWQTMRLIVLPQALRHVIPGIVGIFIALFKDTTLVLIIGLFDLLGIVQAAVSDPQWIGYNVEGYVFAGLGFWLFCFALSRFSQRLERRLAHTSRRSPAPSRSIRPQRGQ